MNRLGKRSRKNLIGVHSDLIILVPVCLYIVERKYGIDFSVFDGVRTIEEQRAYYEAGSSWTMNSKHLIQPDGYGHAVDLVPWIDGKMRFNAVDHLQKIGKTMKKIAKAYRIPLTWGALKSYGGDWNQQNDMYHFELR